MKRRTIAAEIILLILFSGFLVAQEPSGSDDDVIETALERSNAEDDIRNDADILEEFMNEPLDVSHPLYSELIRLPMVSPMLAESMIMFSDTVEITNVEQYRKASAMTDHLFDRLKPFITVRRGKESGLIQSLLPSEFEMRTRTVHRSNTQTGVRQDDYQGGPASVYHRMGIRGSRMEGTFLLEKDPGELYGNGFFSGSLTLKEIGSFQRIILGDFHIATDQGMLFARANSSAKGNDAAGQIRKKGRTLSANTSADEVNSFRGAAGELSTGPLSFLFFVSKKELSASIDTSGAVTSLYTSGLFRSPLELKKKNTVNASTAGGRAGWGVGERSSISMTMMHSVYGRNFSEEQRVLGRRSDQTAGSIAWDISERTFSLFGETATDDLRRFSFSGGIIVPFSRWFSVSYHHRNLVQGYSTPFAHPFGEQSNIAKGESGDYGGLSMNQDGYHLDMYFYRAFFPSFQQSFGSLSSESFISLEFPLSKGVSIYGHMRKKKQIGLEADNGNDERQKTNYRLEFRFDVSRRIRITNRYEVADVTSLPMKNNESGLLMFFDAAYHHSGNGLRIRSRWIFFDSPSYDSRLYQFESGVRGSYSNPPLYGKGMRWYIVAGYEFLSGYNFSFKYSVVHDLNDNGYPINAPPSVAPREEQVTVQLDFQL